MGIILGFDLDETLIGTPGKTYDVESKMYTVPVFTVNELFIDLIHKAIVSRGSDKKVDAIILVTNNTNVITKHAQLTLPFLTLAFGRLLFEYNRKYPPLQQRQECLVHLRKSQIHGILDK
jgi:hypothetical protein